MVEMSPGNLVLRCYGQNIKKGKWYGMCLELDLAVEADSPDELKEKLNEIIVSYIESVLDTGDKNSIPALLNRRAPFKHFLKYHSIKVQNSIHRASNITFNEFIPFKLVPAS